MKLSWLSILRMTVAAVPCFCTMVSIGENVMSQGAMKNTHEWDDLFDGVDKNGDIHVFTYGEEVMCEGKSPEGRNFGASPVWADVTGDNKPELVVGDAYGFLWIFQPTSPPGAFPPRFTTGVFVRTFVGNALNIDVADFDGDGLNDIIVGTADGAVELVRNQGGGEFIKEDWKPNYRGINIHALGHDQKVDVVGRFPLIMHGQFPLFAGLYAAPRLVDWNRDGKKDVIIGEGGYSANSIYLFINNSQTKEPDFNNAKHQWLVYGNGRENLSPAIGDLDGDGDLDLLVGERVGYLTWFENKPGVEGSDTPYLLQPTEKFPSGHVTVGGLDKPAGELPRPYLADIDGDKKLDLLIGCNDGRIMLSRNIGTAKQPVFDTPVILKGIDTAKPRKCPSDWGWDRWDRPNAGNSGFIVIWGTEIEPDTGATTTYARLCYDYGYVGTGGDMTGECGVKYEVEYALSFRARALNVTSLRVRLDQTEEGFVSGDTLQRKYNGFTANFTPGDQWRPFRQKFRWKRLTEEAKDKLTTGLHLHFAMEGSKSDSYLDIADLAVEETHGDEPQSDTVLKPDKPQKPEKTPKKIPTPKTNPK